MPNEAFTDLDRAKRLDSDLARILDALQVRLERRNEAFATDSAILHFNLAFEVAWKLCQTIAQLDGVRTDSPRDALRAAFKMGFADNETRLLGLVQTRNQITHIYRAEFAAAVLAELPQHLATLRELHAHAARRLA
jgi:nucleotidyltransferase substrate binding protein (TIGR01987 family)